MTSDEVNTLFSKKQKIYIKNNLSAIKSNTVIFFKTNDKILYYSANSWVAKWYGYNSVELSNVTTVDENGTVGTQSLHRSGVDLDSNYKVIKTSKLYEENGYVNTQPFNNSNILDQLANFVTTYYGIVKGKEITYKLPENVRQNYQELEYIESTGTQYIKTGLTNRKYYLHKFEIGFNNKIESGMVCGASPSGAYFILQEGTNCYVNTGGQTQGEGNVQVNTYYDYIFDGQSNHQQCYLNGELANETTYQYNNVSTSIELYMFCRNGGTRAENFKSTKIYYFKIYDENRVLIRDYVPAKRKSDSAIGMYDMVSETFFANAGTGAFLYGELQSESEITDVKMGDLQIQSVMLGTKKIWSNLTRNHFKYQAVGGSGFLKNESPQSYTATEKCLLIVTNFIHNTSWNFSCDGTKTYDKSYKSSNRTIRTMIYEMNAGNTVKASAPNASGGDQCSVVFTTMKPTKTMIYTDRGGATQSQTLNYTANNDCLLIVSETSYDTSTTLNCTGELLQTSSYSNSSRNGTTRIYFMKKGDTLTYKKTGDTGIRYPHNAIQLTELK